MIQWLKPIRRCREPETMDDPALARDHHVAALRGLERINRWSRSVDIVWAAIHRLAHESGEAGLRLLDIATGAGDVPTGLARRAHRAGLRLRVDACDVSPTALEHARRRADAAKADVRFFQLDALRDELPAQYDVLVSSLFLHHLADEEVTLLLGRMARAARRLVVANDLRRCRPGLLLAYFGSRFLTVSPVVRADAVRSVHAGFTLDEIRALARQAGLSEAIVDRRWPCRFLLTWKR
ncbi:MAG TPA: methyltransferase domain-containing protein [Phycisphaerae bacterium]|nr:methyltransferase domain-containing protein [Phycisphaerae bacterium]